MQMRGQIVVNARTDVYLLPGGNPDADYAETLRRLIAFREAGADCVFAPGLKDAETIGRLVNAVACPLNILAGTGTPSIPELGEAGRGARERGIGPDARDAWTAAACGGGIARTGTYAALMERYRMRKQTNSWATASVDAKS